MHIYILPPCSTTAARVLNPAGMTAQSQRSRCAISRGILNTLTIRAERRSKVKDEDKENKVIRMERSYGAYSRSFDISGINADKIKAKYDNGVLRLTLPKVEQAKGRHLEIE